MAPGLPVLSHMLEFSPFAQGYWRLDQWSMSIQDRLRFIQQHLELGITTVDHAHLYGQPSCEQLFGAALALQPELRQQLQIVTKCGIELHRVGQSWPRITHYDTRAERIIASLECSLQRLRTDYVDVLLIHRPDYLLDVDEAAAAFSALKQQGKVLHFGVSNFKPHQFDLLQSRLDFPLVTNQVEINPLNLDVLDDGTLDQLYRLKRRPMAWSCLAGGGLFEPSHAELSGLRECLNTIAAELNAEHIDQVLFAWVLALPSRPVPVLGSGQIERVRRAWRALQLKLEPEQWYRIWVAAAERDVP